MKEQLISFETAKLAKVKGFDIPVSCPYNRNAEIGEPIPLTDFNGFTMTGSMTMISAPTQSLLQKWLREKYNIVVWVESMYFDGLKYIPGYEFKIFDFFDNIEAGEEWDLIFDKNHDSYEEALEKILFEALKLIK